MAGGGGPIPKGTFKVVRYVGLKKEQLQQIADILGIGSSEVGDVFSGEIHIVPQDIQNSWGKPKRPPKPRKKR